jgi:mercuric ion binding protein
MISGKEWLVPAAVLAGMTGLPTVATAQDQQENREKEAAVDSLLARASVALRVDGMSCPFCAFGLEKRLRELAAIDTLVVRVSDGLVLIRAKEGHAITDAELEEAVARAGFSLREVRRVATP